MIPSGYNRDSCSWIEFDALPQKKILDEAIANKNSYDNALKDAKFKNNIGQIISLKKVLIRMLIHS